MKLKRKKRKNYWTWKSFRKECADREWCECGNTEMCTHLDNDDGECYDEPEEGKHMCPIWPQRYEVIKK